MGPNHSTVILQASNPQWKAAYEAEARKLKAILGEALVTIYHIGSTAIPGLLAKPIIDIIGEMRSFDALESKKSQLVQAGYDWKGENGLTGRRFLIGVCSENAAFPVHVHLYEAGHPEIETHLIFRDYLLQHPESVAAYAVLKTDLKNRFEDDRARYTQEKAPFIQQILLKARLEHNAQEEQPTEPNWLEWSRNLQSISQIGLAYSKDVFDRQRFDLVGSIAKNMISALAGISPQRIAGLYIPERGYSTPKIDVRAVIFKKGQLLLVRERSDGAWTLPGGWADVGLSAAENTVKEVCEESGLQVRATKLLACLDKRKQGHPPEALHTYKLFFRCEIIGGELTECIETSEAGYFDQQSLPTLSLHRVTAGQVARMFEHFYNPELPTDFD